MRLKELDALRGIAALNVLAFHYSYKFQEEYGAFSSQAINWRYGYYGVELFFIISGFVIFMSLQNAKSLSEFSIKRIIRLYPAYWACLIITYFAVLIFTLPGRETTIKEAVVGLSMLQGLLRLRNVDGSYWSLLPELMFYVMMGLIFYFKSLDKIKIIGALWLGLILLNYFVGIPYLPILLNLNFGMFFYAGIIFYKIKVDKPSYTNHIHILGCYLVALTLSKDHIEMILCTGVFTLFYLFIYDKLKFLAIKPLTFLGVISYPLYLIHQNVGFIIIRYLRQYVQSEIWLLLGVTLFVILFAWVIMKYLEKPMQTFLKKRLNSFKHI